jgi:hypothetical protein
MMYSTVWHAWSYCLPHCTQPATWHSAVESLDIVAVPGEWSTVLALHCSHTVATCPHVLQTWSVMPARKSCTLRMALMLGVSKMCVRALGTCVSSCTGRHVRLFFILEARGA